MPTAALSLSPATVAAVLGGAAACLVAAGTAMQLVVVASGHDHIYGLVPLLDLDQEANLPSFFSALLLVLAAALLALLARAASRRNDHDHRWWALLGCLLLVMAVDEAASLHELLIRPLRELLGAYAGGVLHFTWVLPGALLAGCVALALRGFAARLPAPLRARLLLAAGLYLGGALGMELMGGRYASAYGTSDLVYGVLLVGVEESLELAGAIVLVHALLAHLAEVAPRWHLVFAGEPAAPPRFRACLRARPLALSGARPRPAVPGGLPSPRRDGPAERPRAV